MFELDRFQPGDRFGDLEIQRELARGSYGTVYLAWDHLIGRRVALKWVQQSPSAAHARDLELMLNEARLVGRLKSLHIATLYRVHALEGGQGWLFEMEYVDGGSLQDLLGADRRLAPEEARRIAQGILTGLDHAHEEGIVHGDMKPGNVLLARDRTVKLVDFGLSHLVGEASVSTSGVDLKGTPLYMAPEVVMGERPAVASDLWSVGVVLYRMLAGRQPFPGRTLPSLFYAIHNSTPHRLDPALPPALVDLTVRCLAKLPQDRPASCKEALGELAPAARADGPPTPLPAIAKGPRLFGRADELEQLRGAVRDVSDGHGRTVLISGDTGAGKSLVAHEGITYAARLQFRCAEAHVTGLQGLLRPLLGGVRELLSPASVADSDQRLIETQLFGTATDLLRDLLGTKAPIRLESLQQMLWALEQLLTGLAAPRPLAICVEDTHLAHAEDQELLAEVARRLERARVLLLIVYRSADPEGSTTADAQLALRQLVGHHGVVHIHLDPLQPDAVSRLLHDRADDAQLAPEVLQHILTVAEGNPLFTIELFHHLERSGAVVRAANRIVPGPGWAQLELPERLREMVTLRLQGLPEDQRKVLDIAAVDGVEFDGAAAAAVLGQPLLDVLRTLQQIYRRTGLVVPLARGHRFANAVIQEGIYEDLSPDLRRAMHESLATHLEKHADDDRDVLPERLGQHWERAGQPGRARPHLCRAAREATLRQDLVRAIDFTRRAGLAPAQLDAAKAAEHTDLLLDVSGVYAARGRFDDVERIFRILLEVADQAGDEILQAQVQVRRDHQAYRKRGLEGINEAGLRRAAELLPPSEHRGRAYYLLGIILKYRGDLEEAAQHFRTADEQFVLCHHLGLHSSAKDQLGSVSLRRGRWKEAEALYADASRTSTQAGRHANAAVSEINGVTAAYHSGTLDGLDGRLERSIRTLAREGATAQVAAARDLLSQVLYAQGDSKGAEVQVDEAMAILERAKHVGGQMAVGVQRADLQIITGSLDGARETLTEVRRLAGLREDYRILADVCVLECHVACFLADRDRALQAAEETLQWAHRGGQDAVASEPTFLSLAEAVVYGLRPALLQDVETSLYQVRPKDAARTQRALRVCRGARALWDPAAAPEHLMEAAAALRAPDVGPRRAVLRVVAARLAAEAHHRATQPAEARREAENGLADAVALRHVWLELHFRHFLARQGQGAELYTERLRELAERLMVADERKRFVEAWGA